MLVLGAQDRIRLRGTPLYAVVDDPGAAPQAGAPPGAAVATLERCLVEGLRVRDAGGKITVLSPGHEVREAELDLADGALRVELTDDGRARIGSPSRVLTGKGFRRARTEEELLQQQASGQRRLYLNTIHLRPAGKPEDALQLAFEHFSAEGISFHLPEAGAAFVPWNLIESARVDLLSFRLRIAFQPDAPSQYPWLSGVRVLEGRVRR